MLKHGLRKRLSTPKPKTQTELEAVLNQPISAPCLKCHSAVFAVQHTGEMLCIGCFPDAAHDRRQTAFLVVSRLEPDGRVIAIREAEALADCRDVPEPEPGPNPGTPGCPAGRRPASLAAAASAPWESLINPDRVHGLCREPLAASAVACQCGADTRHKSGVCWTCRNTGAGDRNA